MTASTRQYIVLMTASVMAAAGLGWLIGTHPMIGIACLSALVIGLCVFLWPEAAFVVSILTIVLGQLFRFQIPGSESTVIANDVILPAVIIAWALKKLASGSWDVPRTSLTLPIVAWVGVMITSMVVNRWGYSGNELLSGGLYIIRWIEYAFVLVIGYDVLRRRQRLLSYLRLVVWTAVALAVLGFIQLQIFPDFSSMVPKGWDPHVGRLLSTWFDPNFLAGYFTFVASVVLGVAMSRPWRTVGWWWAAFVVICAATVLTFSRSGYLAFAAGVGFVALFRSRTILIIGMLALISVVLFVPRVQERVVGIRSIDETAQLRLVSWQNAWTVFTDHPVIGVGYNLYKYVQVQYNFLNKTTEHSASGSDSSLLTIGVTTGAIGLAVYLWLYGAMVWEAVKTWRAKHLAKEWQGLGLGVAAGLLALMIHGQFVNGLIYPHLMQVTWLMIAAVIMIRQPHEA